MEVRGVGNHDADLTDYHRTFEEFRYDALGRRVWVRARKDCRLVNHSIVEDLCRLSTIRRTVWDGNQELWEIQMPGSDSSAYLENDVTTLQLPRMAILDPNPSFGRVVYTHGVALDQPLGITRLGYADVTDTMSVVTFPYRTVDPFTIAPLWDAQGQAGLGTFGDGGIRKCEGSRCVYVGWPALWFAYLRPNMMRTFWHGSLLEDKQDATGTQYRRNRYYGPATGRFTQEDPIGLAGGSTSPAPLTCIETHCFALYDRPHTSAQLTHHQVRTANQPRAVLNGTAALTIDTYPLGAGDRCWVVRWHVVKERANRRQA